MRGRILAVLISFAATSAFASDKGVGVPPAPKDAEQKTVESWIERYIAVEDGGWVYISHTDDAAYLLSTQTVEPTKNGTIKFWYRTEYFKAEFSGQRITRSAHALEEIDCTDRRFRLLAVDTYAQNSLGGEAITSHDEPDAAWSFARPNTVAHVIGGAVCDYVDYAVEKAKEAKEGAAEASEPKVRSHF
jgi:hypothetical protein